jgi:hypothetical protein
MFFERVKIADFLEVNEVVCIVIIEFNREMQAVSING